MAEGASLGQSGLSNFADQRIQPSADEIEADFLKGGDSFHEGDDYLSSSGSHYGFSQDAGSFGSSVFSLSRSRSLPDLQNLTQSMLQTASK